MLQHITDEKQLKFLFFFDRVRSDNDSWFIPSLLALTLCWMMPPLYQARAIGPHIVGGKNRIDETIVPPSQDFLSILLCIKMLFFESAQVFLAIILTLLGKDGHILVRLSLPFCTHKKKALRGQNEYAVTISEVIVLSIIRAN